MPALTGDAPADLELTPIVAQESGDWEVWRSMDLPGMDGDWDDDRL
jgi:hypothetical protein